MYACGGWEDYGTKVNYYIDNNNNIIEQILW